MAASIIAFAASMLAVSCGKTGGGNNNNNNSGNNGGGDGNGSGGSGGCTGICPTTNLVLEPRTTPPAWIKISGNTVTLNVAGLAGAVTAPYSHTDPANRGFDDAEAAATGSVQELFNIAYPGAIDGTTAGLFFVNRPHVTKDTITIPATMATLPSHETDDALLAASAAGGMRRFYNNSGGDIISFASYLGSVFDNTDTANRARGTMRCGTVLAKASSSGGPREVVSDTTIFNGDSRVPCQIAVINNGGGASMAEIDDAWVGDSASVKEVELYAIGIDVTGKTISQFSDAPGYNLAEFVKAHDNAAFKRLLQNNPWGELKFKVKIVTAANF